MNIGFILALFSRAPTNILSDAVPFSIAQSHDEAGIVAYTITGPKAEKTRALAFALLGFPWFLGGVMLLFTPNANLTVHPAIAYTVLFGVGGLMLFQAHIRRGAARARIQIEIDTASGDVLLSRSKPTTTARSTEARIICRPNLNHRGRVAHHLVTISDLSDRPLIVLGAFNQPDNAYLYAEILAGETGLSHGIADPPRPLSLQWADRLLASDKRALEKPICTKPLPMRFTA